MKALKILSLLLCMVSLSIHAQTTWIVNNNPNQYADFTTLQEAVDGANDGDVLMIQPSPTSYGDADILKSLTIVGGGYLKDYNASILGSEWESEINNINLYLGSDGSIIKGIEVYTIDIYTSDILIEHCYFPYDNTSINVDGTGSSSNLGLSWNNISNIKINKNRIHGDVYVRDTVENCVIRNNYLDRVVNSIDNHTLLVYNTFTQTVSPGDNIIFYNNIVKSGSISECNTCLSANISYNIASGSVPAIYNNIGDIDMTTVFVSGATHAIIDDPSNPAIGTGINGEDLGMHGGDDSYVSYGIPDHPEIYFLSSPAMQTPESGGLPVEVKVRTNN